VRGEGRSVARSYLAVLRSPRECTQPDRPAARASRADPPSTGVDGDRLCRHEESSSDSPKTGEPRQPARAHGPEAGIRGGGRRTADGGVLEAVEVVEGVAGALGRTLGGRPWRARRSQRARWAAQRVHTGWQSCSQSRGPVGPGQRRCMRGSGRSGRSPRHPWCAPAPRGRGRARSHDGGERRGWQSRGRARGHGNEASRRRARRGTASPARPP